MCCCSTRSRNDEQVLWAHWWVDHVLNCYEWVFIFLLWKSMNWWIWVVLHPHYKSLYFVKAKWPQDWITTAEGILREEWTKNYKVSMEPSTTATVVCYWSEHDDCHTEWITGLLFNQQIFCWAWHLYIWPHLRWCARWMAFDPTIRHSCWSHCLVEQNGYGRPSTSSDGLGLLVDTRYVYNMLWYVWKAFII